STVCNPATYVLAACVSSAALANPTGSFELSSITTADTVPEGCCADAAIGHAKTSNKPMYLIPLIVRNAFICLFFKKLCVVPVYRPQRLCFYCNLLLIVTALLQLGRCFAYIVT